MSKPAFLLALLGALTLAAVPAPAARAAAQDDSEDLDDLEGGGDDLDEDALLEEDTAAAQPDEIQVGGETVGESTGGATGFVFPTGFYVSSDLGGFVRLGGYGDSRDGGGCFRCLPKLFSNLQPWIGINVGYDIIKFVGVELTLGTGFIADAAPVGYSFINQEPSNTDYLDSPENSAITMGNLAINGSYYFGRFAIQGKIFAGLSFLTPDPYPANLNLVRGFTCDAGFWGAPVSDRDCGIPFGADFGIQGGIGGGFRYATLLPGVVIGLDVVSYLVFSRNVNTQHTGTYRFADGIYLPPPFALPIGLPVIPGFSFAPVIKYVF